jgi:CheY-like chemotaxis protein
MKLVKDPLDAAASEFKVLVADDSPIYRKLVEHTLSEKQYAVLFAKSGREAIDLLSEHQPSLVITNWMMPDLSGIELCEHIRKHPRQTYT